MIFLLCNSIQHQWLKDSNWSWKNFE